MSPRGSTTTTHVPCPRTALASSSFSYISPSTACGGVQKIIGDLELERKPHSPSPSHVIAGKKPALALRLHDQSTIAQPPTSVVTTTTTSTYHTPSSGHTCSRIPQTAFPTYDPTPSAKTPSLYTSSRGRSANVSPSRRWDRRGASATVLSGTSGSGSGSGASGEESELTVAELTGDPSVRSQRSATPSTSKREEQILATTTSTLLLVPSLSPRRQSLPRRLSSARSQTASSRFSAATSRIILDEESNNELTSSDEEGAHASRLARSRRASLERDRQRGMRILLAAARRGASEKEFSKEDLDPACVSPGFTSASTSISATNSAPDDLSEPSSAMSRSPSSDMDYLGMHSPNPPQRSRMQSEQGEAAFFGLADDEEDATAAVLSAQALSAALVKKRRSRTRSAHDDVPLAEDDGGKKWAASLPSSRRPSLPRTGRPSTVKVSASAPTRAILGFAPVSNAVSTLSRRRGSSPRRKLSWTLSVPLDSDRTTADLLSGMSVGSVEDYLQVDPVDWDDSEADRRNVSRQSSVASVRSGQASALNNAASHPTVAALEASDLLAQQRQQFGGNSATFRETSSLFSTAAANQSASELSDSEQEAARRTGFAVAYQQRLGNLQSQLRSLSSLGSPPASLSTSGAGRSEDELSSASHSPPLEDTRSGLLASSWRQIARLPNLFFPGAKVASGCSTKASPVPAGDSATGSDGAPCSTTLTGPDVFDSVAVSLISQVSPPETSSIASAADCTQRPILHLRRSSFTSRGVLSPLEGDRDPGAYVTGLGETIDPDVELSSVVHLHSFRARGRSVDTAGRTRHAREATPAERATSSDTESSPLLAAVASTISPLSLALPAAVTATLASNVQMSCGSKLRASFTLHDGDDAGKPEDTKDKAYQARPLKTSPSDTTRPLPAELPDADGFTIVSHRRRYQRLTSAARASRPAAAAPVPQDFSAFDSYSGSGSSDEERPRFLQRSDRKDACTAATSSRSRDDGRGDHADVADKNSRNGEGRGRSRRTSRGDAVSPPRSRQCAVGLFTGRRGSDFEEDSSSVRYVRSSPSLSYAKVVVDGNERPERRGSSRSSVDSNASRAPALTRQRSEQGLSSDEPSGSSRGRGDGVKVTSCSFKPNEQPRNSLPRCASSSGLLDMLKSGSLLKQKPLLSAPTGPAMSLPGHTRSFSEVPVSDNVGTAASVVEAGGNGLLPSSADILQPSRPQQQQQQGGGGMSLHHSSARPTLLSNSAHLLMLSLELEMMRAQKITAPLKVRWVRQRMTVSSSSSSSPADLSSSNGDSNSGQMERGRRPYVGAGIGAGGEQTAGNNMPPPFPYQPRRASRLRHSINA